MNLEQETITFGKYKNKTLKELLKDRNYCEWIKNQKEIKDKYEYIYNRICEYNPSINFFKDKSKSVEIDFMKTYKYFNLIKPENLQIILEDNDKKSYEFYYKLVKDIKNRLKNRIKNLEENPYDIKAPTNWLNDYESITGLNRENFKNFIKQNDLDNITSIIETIKNQGGIDYKGAKSFKISKENSLKQEIYWEKILKEKYGEDIGTQFQYSNCFFDFINIKKNTIYECKLGLKDFNKLQYDKYIVTLNKYKIIYLIGYDIIIDISNSKIYVKDNQIKINLIDDLNNRKKKTYLDDIIKNYEIIIIGNDINCYI
jgi:hypothetical protein